MSTRSLIGIMNKDGSITNVYCHFDGYLDGVGITLVENYDTEDKVNDLLKNGDMSSLGDTISSCEFYKDRGEDGIDAKTIPADVSNIKDVYYESGQNCWADYVYLFEDGKWYYSLERAKYDNGKITYLPAEWKLVVEGLNEKD